MALTHLSGMVTVNRGRLIACVQTWSASRRSRRRCSRPLLASPRAIAAVIARRASVHDADRKPGQPARRRLLNISDSGRLRGKPAGVAYGAARARLSRPRRHSARHRRPQPGDPTRARFRARLPEPRQCLVCARQLRRGIADYDSAIRLDPEFALTICEPRRRAARPRLCRRRHGGLPEGDQPRRQPRRSL